MSTGLDRPAWVTSAPGENGFIYVVEQVDRNRTSTIQKVSLADGSKSTFLEVIPQFLTLFLAKVEYTVLHSIRTIRQMGSITLAECGMTERGYE